MVWIFWFIYMLKLKSSYFLCITSMVLWGMGVGWGTIKFNYTIPMYMYTKRKSKCCTCIYMTLYVTSSCLNHMLPAHYYGIMTVGRKKNFIMLFMM